MPAFILKFVSEYGYLAIVFVVLIQEMGMPGPPNEMILLYFGWLIKQTGLSYPLVILLVTIADIIGSYAIYVLFFYGSEWLATIKPKWINLPNKKIESLKISVAANNGRNIFVAKLTPFVRSYIPVVAGILNIEPVFYRILPLVV